MGTSVIATSVSFPFPFPLPLPLPFASLAEPTSGVEIFVGMDFFGRPGVFLIALGVVFGMGSGDSFGLSFAARESLALVAVTAVSFFGAMMMFEN